MESWKADEIEVKSEERRCNSAKVRRKKIHLRQMLEKSRNAGEIKNCTPLWREAHFSSEKCTKTRQVRTTFWSSDLEKSQVAVAKHVRVGPLFEVPMSKNVHAAVARRTFSSETAPNTSILAHFWKFRCRKNAQWRAHSLKFQMSKN